MNQIINLPCHGPARAGAITAVLSAVLLSLSSVVGAQPPPSVLSPRGGEIIASGDTIEVRWTGTESAPSLSVLLWNGNSGQWSQIAEGLDSGTNQITWIVDDSTGGNLLRVVVIGSDGRALARSLSYFAITERDTQGFGRRTTPRSPSPPGVPAPAIRVYPNPATGVLVVDASVPLAGQLEIRDLLGRPVGLYQFESSIGIPIAGISPGAYLVTVKTEESQRWSTILHIR